MDRVDGLISGNQDGKTMIIQAREGSCMNKVLYLILSLILLSGCATITSQTIVEKFFKTYSEHKESLPTLTSGGRIIFYQDIDLLRKVQNSTGMTIKYLGVNTRYRNKHITGDIFIYPSDITVDNKPLKDKLLPFMFKSGVGHPSADGFPSCHWLFVDLPAGKHEIAIYRRNLRDKQQEHLALNLEAGQTRYVKVASWIASMHPDHFAYPPHTVLSKYYQGGNIIKVTAPNTAEEELRKCTHDDKILGKPASSLM